MRTLAEWLTLQESVHPKSIDMGLARVSAVARTLGLAEPACAVITVGGTNGKGSMVAHLEALLCALGVSTGMFTSPHFLRYNERIRVDGGEVGDAELIAAFERIEAARGDTTLTFFEYNTLAALLHLRAAPRRGGGAGGRARRPARRHQPRRCRRRGARLGRFRSPRLAGRHARADRRGESRHLPPRPRGGARHAAHAGERIRRHRRRRCARGGGGA